MSGGNSMENRDLNHNLLRELVDSRLCKMDQVFYASSSIGPVPRVTSISLDAIDILRDNGTGYREGLHNYRHIRANPSDDILITLPLASHVCQTQSGRVADFDRGSFSILSTARPFRARISRPAYRGKPLAIMARVTSSLLRQKFPRIDDCFGIPAKLQPGAGSVMRALLAVALEEGRLMSGSQRLYLSRMLLDAIGQSMLEAPEFAHLMLPQEHASTKYLYERARFFVINNLGNPDLGVQLVANHCKVSPRYLRDVFSRHDSHTVVSLIREERLLRCRSDLMNSSLSAKPISNLAMAWGFNDPAYFGKMYRQRFGNTPGQDRKS